jgi:pimeloyl-ACP methyl ester carboxylesterase
VTYLIWIVLLLAGAPAYHAIASSIERRRPPGRLIEVNGHRLHVVVLGADRPGPTVVIETGRQNPVSLWLPLAEAVSRFAPVLMYDRPGYGWSGPMAGAPRTPEEITGTLHKLLAETGLAAPYLLVGHSQGGLYARLFAARYPEQAAGLVLIDPTHDGVSKRFPQFSTALDLRVYRLLALAGRTGLLRIITRFKPGLLLGGADFLARYPAGQRGQVRASLLWPGLFPACANESAAWPAIFAELRRAPLPADLPLIVLTRSRAELAGWGLSGEEQQEGLQIWREGHAELARQSSRGRLTVVENAGHMIMIEQPDAVIAAIRELLQVHGHHQGGTSHA